MLGPRLVLCIIPPLVSCLNHLTLPHVELMASHVQHIPVYWASFMCNSYYTNMTSHMQQYGIFHVLHNIIFLTSSYYAICIMPASRACIEFRGGFCTLVLLEVVTTKYPKHNTTQHNITYIHTSVLPLYPIQIWQFLSYI